MRCNLGKMKTVVANMTPVYKVLNTLPNKAFVNSRLSLSGRSNVEGLRNSIEAAAGTFLLEWALSPQMEHT